MHWFTLPCLTSCLISYIDYCYSTAYVHDSKGANVSLAPRDTGCVQYVRSLCFSPCAGTCVHALDTPAIQVPRTKAQPENH